MFWCVFLPTLSAVSNSAIMFTLMLLLSTYWCLSPCPTFPHKLQQAMNTPPSCSDDTDVSFLSLIAQSGPTSVHYWHSQYGLKTSQHHNQYVVLIGLLLSRQIESNPVPRSPKYPCGEFSMAVRWGRSSACNICHTWFHKDCLQMTSANFEASKDLSW